MNSNTKYFAKNSVTGLYFNGCSFCDSKPTKQFDSVEIAWIKACWDNVVSQSVSELGQNIINAKAQAGPNASLWAHGSEDVILWVLEGGSPFRAIAKWKVDTKTLGEIGHLVH